MSDLALLSHNLGVSERTLRRAANAGLLKAKRVSERRVEVSDAERRYLKRSWSTLAGLRQALRTEPNVRMGILFGSVARGDATADSDVDVLVDLRDPDRFRMLELEERVTRALGRRVQLLRLSDARREGTILGDVLADGRVIVDRDNCWGTLSEQSDLIRRIGEDELDARARKALARARRVGST
jgi:predicted nucleotidyltransferase